MHKHRRQQSFQLAFFSASFEGKYVLYHSKLKMNFKNHKKKRQNLRSQHGEQKIKKGSSCISCAWLERNQASVQRGWKPIFLPAEISVVLKAQASELISLETRDVSFTESSWVWNLHCSWGPRTLWEWSWKEVMPTGTYYRTIRWPSDSHANQTYELAPVENLVILKVQQAVLNFSPE